MSCSQAHHTDNSVQKVSPKDIVKQQTQADIQVTDIQVNDVCIKQEQIAREVQNHAAASAAEAIHLASEALVIRELLLQQAEKNKFIKDAKNKTEAEQEQAISQLLEKEVVTPKADEQTCLQYFSANREKFHTPYLVEASHILLAVAAEDTDKRMQQKELAKTVLQQLNDNPELFAELAKTYSACPSKEVAGSLGQLTQGSTVPEFEKYLFSLSEGLSQQIIETRYGYHIVRIDHKVESDLLPFEAVKDKIAHYLEHQAYRTAISGYIQLLAGEADIKGFEMQGADSPLVQ